MKRLLLPALVFAVLALPVSAGAKTYDKDYIGKIKVYRAAFEDTFVHLARDNDLGFVEMRAANPNVDPWIPGAGTKIILPKQHLLPDAPREGIVINLPEMRLYFFPKGGTAPKTYSIGIGREGLKTPVGSTKIAWKKVGPTWSPTPRMRKEDPSLPATVPAGPENPMGTHAMYLGWPQYAIHGTNKPYGIGRRVSSGCIRMYPEGIKDIFPRVPVGTKVSVVDQPVKVGWIEDKMYIEVHPTQKQSLKIEDEGLLKAYEITKEDMKRIAAKAGSYAGQIDWESVREAVRSHSGYPVAVLDKRRKMGQRVQDDLQVLLEEAGTSKKEIKLEAAKGTQPQKKEQAPKARAREKATLPTKEESSSSGASPVPFND
ncbi:MAG: L,D-transpeptidase family protein [Rhodospirillales bacterium]|nr:L,D-transpeptidase family protein [Alphaproteobacteria bacterium]USO03884.1 MAG: L,D-transpeptidase family protein [Rhodospirillales bacterium]